MPEYNPYAPPRANIRPPDEATDAPRWQEATLRLGGWIGLIVSFIVIVVFGLGTFSEYNSIVSEDGGFDPWKYREWVARMTGVQLACLLAAVTSWGLIRLRRWARLALTVVTVSPFPVLLLIALLFRPSFPRVRETFDLQRLGIAFAVSCAFYLPILSLLWSPGGRRIFSAGHVPARGRMGCLAILAAPGFVFAEGVAYTMLVLSVVTALDGLGVFAD
jgi:hypothetical protein